MNLLTKFRKFWRTLSPLEQKRLYEIMTALRGEDNGSSNLKYQTTARIRGLLFGVKLRHKGVKGFFRPNLHPLPQHPILENNPTKLQLNANAHFLSHVRDAVWALKPYVKKEKFTDLLKFIGQDK